MNAPSLSARQIQSLLRTQLLGCEILCVPTLDSTNREMRRHAHEWPAGQALIADEQTAGRGRLGRSWTSPAGGLWMSVLCRPDKRSEPGLLTLMTGTAVCRALRGETGLNIGIKWPNDLMIGGRKLCGILGEMVTAGGMENTVILGIGVNVLQKEFPPALAHTATSLYRETGRMYDRAFLTAAILNSLDKAYHDLLTYGRAKELISDCSALCETLGREVRVIRPDGEITGKAHSIAADGALCVQTGQGLIPVYAGEVSVRGTGEEIPG